jgi:hypothetical protein
MFMLYGTPTSGPSVPDKPALSQSPALTSLPSPSHQEFFDQFFSNLSSTIACAMRHPPTSSPLTPAPTVSVQSPAPPTVPAPTPAPASLPVSTPDSAEVHLTRLERDLAELQKATVPEPKPDLAHVCIAKLEKELEELCKPSLVSPRSVQSPPPASRVDNQTSPVFMVHGAEIIEQVRQTPPYMLARGELALRASTFMITEPSRVPDAMPHPANPAPQTS